MMQPKPLDSRWTDEQWSAISLQGCNMLVAAAAGSGKTAVLVQRIIRRIADEGNRVDVDRLLVATFTNAAAAEMRQRIREALEQELDRNPQSQHLRRQLALMQRASITTIHSFCLEVIQRYFHRIELDPAFRIANETEAELMRRDVLEELFEQYYEDSVQGSTFWSLVDWFSGERNDDALYVLVQRIYDYSRSHPSPEYWLAEMAGAFDIAEMTALTKETADGKVSAVETPWHLSLLQDVQLELSGVEGLLRVAIKLAELPSGPAPYLDNLQVELQVVQHLLEVMDHQRWEPLYDAFQLAGFGRLKPCKGDEIDKQLQEQVKNLRDQARKQFNDMKEQLFQRSPSVYVAELKQMEPLMQVLVEIVNQFGDRYRKAKQAKGLVDFADLEHYCLQILRDANSPPEELKPSEAALEYREQFVEVLLDEYQDTNTVQEAIITLISQSDDGNRFMVGDVKQSIYRFRLAEPGLFLGKYRSYGKPSAMDANQHTAGTRIDLARNFRSRQEIVDGVNFLCKQLMSETVAEIAYDATAELVYGANYSQAGAHEVISRSVEVLLIDRFQHERADGSTATEQGETDVDFDDTEQGEAPNGEQDSLQELREMETAQLEGRAIATQIKMLTEAGGKLFHVSERGTGGTRPIAYRDIVILLRATQQWTPIMMEELRLAGIPAYADVNTGYFTATEIEIILSLLKVIDNPYQDIPLASVLRSPMFQLTAEEMALIRIHSRHATYYDALGMYAAADTDDVTDPVLQEKLREFMHKLESWRGEARQGSLADLIWRIYRETGYYDVVGGQPGGIQRQANLRALYDRARQYEATSFRGLFRFLRFIERMQESGGDLGTARALGEQEDVVRIMSIHKSKGLEFPVVFVAGLGKMFNQQDLNGNFLLHKRLGFGPKFVNTKLRISYPTLPGLAIKRRLRMEMLAEEMRILYVALTRAKEKLFLVATVRNLAKQVQNWGQFVSGDQWNLPDYALAKARSYLDWIGPALIRHPQAEELRTLGNLANEVPSIMADERSRWKISYVADPWLEPGDTLNAIRDEQVMNAMRQMVPISTNSSRQDEISQRLAWTYPFQQATELFSKTSISEMKRMADTPFTQQQMSGDEGWEAAPMMEQLAPPPTSLLRRPRFIEQQKLSPTERGTVYHAVMQHIQLTGNDGHLSEEIIEQTIEWMVERQLLTLEQKEVVDISVIANFFAGKLGQRMLRAERVQREVPFSIGLSASEVYPDIDEHSSAETVLIQGVIDCLFEEGDGLVLVDYKTDAIYGSLDTYVEKYRLQMSLYANAIESIWRRPVNEKYLFFFDGSHTMAL